MWTFRWIGWEGRQGVRSKVWYTKGVFQTGLTRMTQYIKMADGCVVRGVNWPVCVCRTTSLFPAASAICSSDFLLLFVLLFFAPDSLCSGYKNCSSCLSGLGCGWCEDRMQTGLGTCHLGNRAGPVKDDGDFYGLGQPSSRAVVPRVSCPSKRWYFTGQCPGERMLLAPWAVSTLVLKKKKRDTCDSILSFRVGWGHYE